MNVIRGQDGRIVAPVLVEATDGRKLELSFERDPRTGRIAGEVLIRRKEPA
jgi:hypothetical protein